MCAGYSAIPSNYLSQFMRVLNESKISIFAVPSTSYTQIFLITSFISYNNNRVYAFYTFELPSFYNYIVFQFLMAGGGFYFYHFCVCLPRSSYRVPEYPVDYGILRYHAVCCERLWRTCRCKHCHTILPCSCSDCYSM
jgi:hypothetical protein